MKVRAFLWAEVCAGNEPSGRVLEAEAVFSGGQFVADAIHDFFSRFQGKRGDLIDQDLGQDFLLAVQLFQVKILSLDNFDQVLKDGDFFGRHKRSMVEGAKVANRTR